MIKNTYIVFGLSTEPQVHVLDEVAQRRYEMSIAVFAKHATNGDDPNQQAAEKIFGKGIQWAIPAWNKQILEVTALHFHGPHEAEVQRIAACMALGKPFSKWDEDGGKKVKLVPVRPIKPHPGGETVDGQPALIEKLRAAPAV